MKYLKMLGLTAVAAMAMMALVGAGSASASVICSTTTTPCGSPWPTGTTMNFSLVGTAKLTTDDSNQFVIDTCTGGGVKGNLTNGSATTTASGTVTTANLTWSGCSATTVTKAGGSLEVHNIAGTSNGTVTAKEFTVTINTGLFGTCEFTAGATPIDLGTLTEGKAGTTANPDATLHVKATVFRDSGFCPNGIWEATYVLTEPKETTLSVSAS